MNLFTLSRLCLTDKSTIQYCQKKGLLPKKTKCPTCKNTLKIVKKRLMKNRKRSTYFFKCTKAFCRKSGKDCVQLRKGSFFANSKLSFRRNLFLIYCFLKKMSYADAIYECSISEDEVPNIDTASTNIRIPKMSSNTVARFYDRCREICTESIVTMQKQNKIGGKDEIVQIDEAKFGKHKYHKGKITNYIY